MIRIAPPPQARAVLRPFLPLYLAKLGLLLAVDVLSLIVALRTGAYWLLLGTPLVVSWAILITARFNTEAILLYPESLLCCQGALRETRTIFLRWQVEVQIRRTLLGRLLGYGHVRLTSVTDRVELRYIAHVGALDAWALGSDSYDRGAELRDRPLPIEPAQFRQARNRNRRAS